MAGLRPFLYLVLIATFSFPLGGAAQVCPCDCDGNGRVTVNELVRAVNVPIGLAGLEGCEAADSDGNGSVAINELIRCVNAALAGCDAALGGPPPGMRRFSLDPARSQFVAELPGFGGFPSTGFTGFMDLRARRVFQSTTYFLDVMDASDFFSVETTAGATCVRPVRSALPVLAAGVLYCSAGSSVDIALIQDRAAGFVGFCVDDAAPCSLDEDCASGSCFLAEDCDALGGTVESAPEGEVCFGPIEGVLGTDSSPEGSALIVPDPDGRVVGFPVEILAEVALPCGDEPSAVGQSTSLVLTTGTGSSQILNLNGGDLPDGEVFESSVTGEPFDCERWTGGDRAGAFVFSAPVLNFDSPTGTIDFISNWIWVD